MTEFGGLGHSAVIHTKDQAVIDEFARRVRTGRLLVNSPSSHGELVTTTVLSFLNLGLWFDGKNATTDNVSGELDQYQTGGVTTAPDEMVQSAAENIL